MKFSPVAIPALLCLLSTSLSAEVVIKRYAPGEKPVRSHVTSTKTDLPGPSATFDGATFDASATEKVEIPTTFYILPFFKIDSSSEAGETTFISIRNESVDAQTVTLQILEPNSASPAVTRQNALLPKETWVLNMRSVVTHAADADGFIRGWARILSSDKLTADFFQFNPSQDFATGAIPIDIDNGGFCSTVKSRFLVGGTFDGGTLITFMQDQALGADPMMDPPSITGTVYLEDSTPAGTFEIYTDRFTLEVNAEDLLMPGVNFGSIDIMFENAFGGGAAFTEYKANNRFSVGLKSVCLDTP